MTKSSTKTPTERMKLQKGHQYIRNDHNYIPCPPDSPDLQTSHDIVTVLSNQMGGLVLEYDSSCVEKSGFRVRSTEAKAMRLVFEHTDVLVPEVVFTNFRSEEKQKRLRDLSNPDSRPSRTFGLIAMSIISGTALEQKWNELDDKSKESICLQLWDMISKIRTIPCPSELKGLISAPRMALHQWTQCSRIYNTLPDRS
ncbi:kinase-like protein [Penicillium taxi]|uniref:kinase-like protein n=1 Tax=Penicillium taxi TaxID=168475 RepID=UPI00254535F4|nr:kinase-like protein [Penicillium taxi]KAJ5893487.1 kinase-like protein [Penicillium taxi]